MWTSTTTPPRWDDRNSRGHGVFKEPAAWGGERVLGQPP